MTLEEARDAAIGLLQLPQPTPAELDAGLALAEAAETQRRLVLYDARWARLVRAVGLQAERDRAVAS